ncbi:MAG TPA: hypothetical protein DEB40_10150 [Elusimicrobia bacterium]|nr:hypothetical protein [Elusimicrobiota bacterium]HBT62091.1 hypothetical protein [Elusimicrobiota bacterium]
MTGKSVLLFLAAVTITPLSVAGGTAYGVPALSREDFNRLAAAGSLPLYWQSGTSEQGLPKAEDLLPIGDNAGLQPYVQNNGLSDAFKTAYLRLVDARRLEAVRRELDQGRPVVMLSDFRRSPEPERILAAHLAAAGRLIDELYRAQKGSLDLQSAIPATDTASRALFERNHGPWCGAPATQDDPFCNALSAFPQKRSDAYPKSWQQDAAMCQALRQKPNHKELLDPFTVVREQGGQLKAFSLYEAYGERMRKVAAELRLAAKALGQDESALRRYLLAAASGFESNDWTAADEAWAVMNGKNSRWYLRVGPDEVDFETCQEKAGFHLAWARMDKSALAWQEKLLPLRQDMEDRLAALIGPPYKARQAAFNLPDFISVVLNAGDSRPGLGAVMGQSLPNWGKVAQAGRRRTVVMTNVYSDPDSKRLARDKAGQLLDPGTFKYYSDEDEPDLLGTILHEAAHNLGPDFDTRVDGKGPAEIFGGRLEGVLEELKAQTASLWYTDFLRRQGLISDERARQVYVRAIAWSFGHISQGMFSDGDNPKPYSQLSAVQIGSFIKDGAMAFERVGDRELFRIDFDRLPAAIEALMQRVGRVKATGDAAGAKAFIDSFVTGPDSGLVRAEEVQRRLRRFPKQSFSYTLLY